MPELPLIARARGHAASVAFRSPTGDTTYQELLDRSAALATTLLAGADDLKEARVALLAPAGPGYVAAKQEAVALNSARSASSNSADPPP